ncbi:hypothetical protein TrRE_jg2477, partial [Triparma retinervis]
MQSRSDQNREIAAVAGARMARPAAPRKAANSIKSTTTTAASSTPFGNVRRKNGNHGGSQDWCGPFSVARRLIQEREAKKRKREAKLERRRQREEAGLDPDEGGSGDDSEDDDEEDGGSTSAPRTALDDLAASHRDDLKKLRNPSLTWQPSFSSSPSPSTPPKSNNQYANRKRQRDSMTHHATVLPSLASHCVNFLVDNFECIESL